VILVHVGIVYNYELIFIENTSIKVLILHCFPMIMLSSH
jgi:hypothetical protein